jgi:hypothetical protein
MTIVQTPVAREPAAQGIADATPPFFFELEPTAARKVTGLSNVIGVIHGFHGGSHGALASAVDKKPGKGLSDGPSQLPTQFSTWARS